MKILVTTDFSTNSKSAIRFAHTLAKQSEKIEVIFYHAVHFLQPTRWSDDFFNSYKKDETERLLIKLKKFTLAVIGKEKEKFASIKFIIDAAISIEKNIIKYAEQCKVDYICIATQGAGILRKIMGTNTSYIVNKSKIPVLVIPSHYRPKTLKKATYLSDFENLKQELDKVTEFSSMVKCSLGVLHYSGVVLYAKKFERNKQLFNKEEYKGIKLNIVENNLDLSLVERVSNYVDKSKPELLIMFTEKEKGFLESVFLPSQSVELTYTTKVPILIYSKSNHSKKSLF